MIKLVIWIICGILTYYILKRDRSNFGTLDRLIIVWGPIGLFTILWSKLYFKIGRNMKKSNKIIK